MNILTSNNNRKKQLFIKDGGNSSDKTTFLEGDPGKSRSSEDILNFAQNVKSVLKFCFFE